MSKNGKTDRIKIVDFRYQGESTFGEYTIRIEVWSDAQGNVVKYNMAFICHSICSEDNGRVLCYDNAHGHHERHHMGTASEVEFDGYDAQLSKFQQEVEQWV